MTTPPERQDHVELTVEERAEAVRAGRAAYERWRSIPNRDAYLDMWFAAASAAEGAQAIADAVATRVRARVAEEIAETLDRCADQSDTAERDFTADTYRAAATIARERARPAAGTDQPRCSKCQTPLAACDCGQPAQCGEATCAACTPDQPQDRTEETHA